MKKVDINIVYAPQTGPTHKVFENERGVVWHSKKRLEGKINIGMGWYSIREPKGNDCIMVIEPYCVLPRDYNIKFAGKYRYIFTWATKAFNEPQLKTKVVPINHPSCRDLLAKKNIGNDWLPWKDRKDEIVFIANNKSSTHSSELYTLRVKLADWFHQKSKYKVSWYGQIPLKKPYYKGQLKSKQKLLTKVKFSVCTENSYHPMYTHNYFTEKMPEV